MIKNILISESSTIYSALEKLQQTGEKCLIVVNHKNSLLGTLADGDVRRAILKKINIYSTIKKIYKKNCFSIYADDEIFKKRYEILRLRNLSLIPILSKKREVINYISHSNLPSIKKNKKIQTEVIIMAGGEGTRLRPLTNVMPKPLIPLDGKTVIENIINTFTKYEIKKFYISINFKSAMMKSFFKELSPKYKYKFIEEKKALGTSGSLAYLKPKKKIDYIITNCDTLTDIDFSDFFNFHKKNKNDITILTSSKEFKIPYGICEISSRGILKKIIEKPSQNHLVNTGIYIVNSKILKLIKKGNRLDFNQFIDIAIENKKKISVFPISANSWFDTGQWSDYVRTKKTYDKK
jgi:dTDP-glucose pyrophosphorylase/predicted transcriptional regulator